MMTANEVLMLTLFEARCLAYTYTALYFLIGIQLCFTKYHV